MALRENSENQHLKMMKKANLKMRVVEVGLFVVSLVALVGLQTLCFWCFVSGLVGSFGLEDFEISNFRKYFSHFRWIVEGLSMVLHV